MELLRGAIGPELPYRLAIALATAEAGDAERLTELLVGWSFEPAGLDLDRSSRLAAAHGYVGANRRAIEQCAIVPLASADRSAVAIRPWPSTRVTQHRGCLKLRKPECAQLVKLGSKRPKPSVTR